MCSDWELNWWLFGSQEDAQTIEPHWPRYVRNIFNKNVQFHCWKANCSLPVSLGYIYSDLYLSINIRHIKNYYFLCWKWQPLPCQIHSISLSSMSPSETHLSCLIQIPWLLPPSLLICCKGTFHWTTVYLIFVISFLATYVLTSLNGKQNVSRV